MNNFKENLILIIGMVVILGTHLVGCERISVPPVVIEPELMPKLELFVTPQGEIPYGGVATLKWRTTNALRVFVDGERQEGYKEGNLGTGNLFKTTAFSVKAVNVKLSVTESVTVEVGPWWESTFGLVSYYPWRYKLMSITDLDGNVLSWWWPTEEEKSWVDSYHKDGTVTYSNHPGVRVSWEVPNDSTITINGTSRRLRVNQEEMVISYQFTWNGQIAWANLIYEHASDVPTDSE